LFSVKSARVFSVAVYINIYTFKYFLHVRLCEHVRVEVDGSTLPKVTLKHITKSNASYLFV
jgi:hypothetical protein